MILKWWVWEWQIFYRCLQCCEIYNFFFSKKFRICNQNFQSKFNFLKVSNQNEFSKFEIKKLFFENRHYFSVSFSKEFFETSFYWIFTLGWRSKNWWVSNRFKVSMEIEIDPVWAQKWVSLGYLSYKKCCSDLGKVLMEFRLDPCQNNFSRIFWGLKWLQYCFLDLPRTGVETHGPKTYFFVQFWVKFLWFFLNFGC